MKRMNFNKKIIIWLTIINFLPLFFLYYYLMNIDTEKEIQNIKKNLLEVSKLIVENEEIKNELKRKERKSFIDNEAEKYIKIFKDIDIIVVADENGVKYSHLDKTQIGEDFVNPVEWEKIKRKEGYFSKMKGSIGITFRRFEPLVIDKNRIGFVMVGKYNVLIEQKKYRNICVITLLFFLTLMFAFILTLFFARNMKKKLFGLEPEEIGRLYFEEELIINTLEAGLIALNKDNEIIKINSIFRKKYGRRDINELLSKIKDFLKEKNEIRHLVLTIDRKEFYVDILSIYNEKEYFGSLVLLKTREEVDEYLDKIAGIGQLIDGMRANIHEFKNKLHIILGLINIDKIDLARKYILEMREKNEYDFKKYREIENYFLKGVILGKESVCKEKKIEFVFNEKSNFKSKMKNSFIEDIVLIIGNLIENAMDSFELNKKENYIKFGIYDDERKLIIEVEDNGAKIPKDIKNKIFEYGFSTKGENRGIGLYLVKEKVEMYNGSIEIIEKNKSKIFKVEVEKI